VRYERRRLFGREGSKDISKGYLFSRKRPSSAIRPFFRFATRGSFSLTLFFFLSPSLLRERSSSQAGPAHPFTVSDMGLLARNRLLLGKPFPQTERFFPRCNGFHSSSACREALVKFNPGDKCLSDLPRVPPLRREVARLNIPSPLIGKSGGVFLPPVFLPRVDPREVAHQVSFPCSSG